MGGRFLVRAALVAAALAASPAAAFDKLVNTPAEKFVTPPGGVDLRTGRFVYNEGDLPLTLTSISGGALQLGYARSPAAPSPGPRSRRRASIR